MEYITIYEIFDRRQIPVVKKLFEENQLDYRILEAPTNDTTLEGAKLQVVEDQKKKARAILFEKGFMRKSFMDQKGGPKSRFWIFLIFAVIIVIIVGLLVNWYMN